MAQTGGKYFRTSGSPNVRQQDGPKEHLLCADCEQRFSTHEGWFAADVFKPYVEDGAKRFPYEKSLFYFSVSLLWRVLDHDLRRGLHERVAHFQPLLEQAEREWRSFLLGGPAPATYGDVHVFLTDVGLVGGKQPVEGFNLYMARAVDGEVIGGRSRCLMYAKLARFTFFASITPVAQTPNDGTKIHPEVGILTVPQSISDGWIGEFLVDRARTLRGKIGGALSSRQQERIGEYVKTNAQRILASDLGKVLVADRTAKVVPLIDSKIGRNEPCPCGSGKKYKKCHLGSEQ